MKKIDINRECELFLFLSNTDNCLSKSVVPALLLYTNERNKNRNKETTTRMYNRNMLTCSVLIDWLSADRILMLRIITGIIIIDICSSSSERKRFWCFRWRCHFNSSIFDQFHFLARIFIANLWTRRMVRWQSAFIVHRRKHCWPWAAFFRV